MVLCLMLVTTPAMAGQQKEEPPQKPSDNYDVLYARYLKAARALPVTTSAPDTNWMTGLLGDLRARHVNDLVTIRVVESISAVGSADANLDKNGSASASLTHLFGLESAYPNWLDPTSLVAYVDGSVDPIAVSLQRTDDRLEPEIPDHTRIVTLVARVDDRSVVVARYAKRSWW